MKKTVLIGMSGGVDSSVAAAILKEEYNVIGVTLKLHCHTDQAVEDAKKVCQTLGIEHRVRDLSSEFKKYIIGDFINEYSNARTPNPCIWCNYYIKFGAMLDIADEMGIDYIATGHYVRKEFDAESGEFVLKPALGVEKDQTYALYRLKQSQLARSIFPLGDIPKDRVREIGASIGLHVAEKKDSQEICFIPDNDYASYVENVVGKSEPGEFIGPDGEVLGIHNGLIHYTVGQRRGLGVAYGERIYVARLDKETNRVHLGTEGVQNTKTVHADNLTFITEKALPTEFDCFAKIRYNGRAQKAKAVIENDALTVEFEKDQRAAAPGQSVVLYKDGVLLGGGIIKA